MDIISTLVTTFGESVVGAVKDDPQDFVGYGILLPVFRDRLPFWPGGGATLGKVNEKLARIEGMLTVTKSK